MALFRELKLALDVLFEGRDRSVVWRLGLTSLLAITGGALAALAPVAIKDMIDAIGSSAAGDEVSHSIAFYGAAYLACIGTGRVFTELRPLLSSAAEQRLFARLRTRFFGHLLALPLSFHLGRRTGAIGQMPPQAISGYQILIHHLHSSVLPVAVELATVTLVLTSLGQPALMATFAITALAYVAILTRRTAGLATAAGAVSQANLEINGLLTDGLINYEPIKCFGAERSVLGRFRQAARTLEGSWARLQGERMKIGLASAAVSMLSISSAMTIAGLALAGGELSVGSFVMANMYMLQIMRPLEMLSIALRDASQSLALTRPLIDILGMPGDGTRSDHETGPDNQEGAHSPATAVNPLHASPGRAAEVSFRGIQMAYNGGDSVLKDFCLDVPAGRTLAIVGASGSGKSSLARLLMGLCEPQAGSILLGGVPITDMPASVLRTLVAVVPQDVALFNTTIADNIAIGKNTATPDEIISAARIAGLHDFVSALPMGYATPIGERGLRLSGGERQRISIARAVLRDPLVLIFDEATSMLDAHTEAQILRNLKNISAGRTTITIAHRLSVAQDADTIAVLEGGCIVEQGNHQALMDRQGAYAAMWEAQRPMPGLRRYASD